jgi:sirohydrochlorin ferrochelatase
VKAVLFVGHGSRRSKSNEQFIQFANAVGNDCQACLFRYAFLELATPSIVDEIKVCVEQGATEIVVFPLLLLTAGHAKVDIPNEVAKGKEMFPAVSFRIEKPLGIQEVLISILEKRLLEKQFLPSEKTLVILVGRGSNDQGAISDFEMVAQLLREKLQFSQVETSYLVGGHISFKDCVQNAQQSNFNKIFILPYLLFTGLLLKEMEEFIAELEDERFIMCQPIGADQTVVNLVSSLINETV